MEATAGRTQQTNSYASYLRIGKEKKNGQPEADQKIIGHSKSQTHSINRHVLAADNGIAIGCNYVFQSDSGAQGRNWRVLCRLVPLF